MDSRPESVSRLPLILAGVVTLAIVAFFLFVYVRGFRQDSASETAVAAPAEMPPVVGQALDTLRAGDADEAVRQLEAIGRDSPAYTVALQNLGAVYFDLGQPAKAMARLRELVALQRGNPEAWRQLAWGYHRSGNDVRAETSILRALEVAPDHVGARYDVAFFRVALGDVAHSVETYHRAIGLAQDRAQVLRTFQDLERLHEARPAQPAVHYALAYLAGVLGRESMEIAELEHYIEIAPEGDALEQARARLEALGQSPK